MYLRLYAVVTSLLLTATLTAQNLTAPLIAGSWQSTYHNPAMLHFLPSRVTVGLPGLANDLRLENLQYGDIIVREGGQRIIRLSEWSRLAEAENGIQDVFSIETGGLAVRTGAFVFSGYHRLRTIGQAEYPKTLVDVLALGNAPFIGQSIEIAPVGEILSFQEVGLGASYAISERIALAGRVKYLAGVSTIQTAGGNSLQLTTGEENYALTLDQDFTLNTVRAVSYTGLDEFSFLYNPNRLQPGDLLTGNTGLAFDVGVAVNLDRLRLNASATDLGAAIDWNEDITSLRFSGSRSFTGLDILTDLLSDSVSLESAVDSLVQTFEPTQRGEGFRSEIGASYYLGGEYDLTERITAGALIVLEDRLEGVSPAFALSGRYTVTDWLRVGVNLNHRTGIRTNLGLHLYATPGRVQLFVSSDKFFSLLSTGDTSLAGLRLGAALALGERLPNRSSFATLP